MKLFEYLRRQFGRLVSGISLRTGISEQKARRLLVVVVVTMAAIPLAVLCNVLALDRVAPLHVEAASVDRIVQHQADIKRIETYGLDQLGDKVALYTYWKNGQSTLTEIPRPTYFNLENTVLLPKGVKVEFKQDSEKPGAYPAYEGIKGALLNAGRVGGSLVSLLGLILIAQMMGLGRSSRFQVIMPQNVTGSMDDLIGIKDIKEEVLMLADLFERRHLFNSHGIRRAWNILFSGPAGVGKTKLAGYLAKRLNVPMLFIDGSRLEDGFVGGGSRTLHKLHSKAASYGRCIVFIDEGQALLMRRGTDRRQRWEDDTPNTLLSLLDGVRTKNDAEIIWVVASNFDHHTSTMDDAVLRRFQLKVNFRLPNKEERLEMLQRFVDRRDQAVKAADIDYTMLAQASAGLSPAILETIVDQASLISIRENVKLDGPLLMRALERTLLGLADRAQTGHLEKEREIVATHEVGHFLAAVLRHARQGLALADAKEKCETIKISIEAVSSLGALGYALNNAPEVRLFSVNDLEWQVRGLYGGRAAEHVVYGEHGVTSGAGNDIEKASEILTKMVGALGMRSAAPVNLLKYRGGQGGPVLSRQEEMEIGNLARELYADTLHLMEQYRATLIRIRDRLLENYTLDRDELFALLAQDWPVPTPGAISDLLGKYLPPYAVEALE